MASGRRRPPIPSPDELAEIVHERGGRVSARDLARELGLSGGAKAELKRRLREADPRGARRAPSMVFCEVSEVDADGEVWAESGSMPGAAILIRADRPGTAPGVGDRLLARLSRDEDGTVVGRVFKLLPRASREIVGVLQQAGGNLVLVPSRREAKQEFFIRREDVPADVEAEAGDIVRATLQPGGPLARPLAKIVERIGRSDEPAAVSLAVAMELELPVSFRPAAIDAAEAAEPVALGRREDLRDVPLVTIDGADARDFDDAVWAMADEAPDNPGGHVALVAIADVAHYVRPGDVLDEEAFERGNSVYFPDRVIPMLPEALSNGLCSLRPDEDRACIACRMRFDIEGHLLSFSFVRGLMRSRARLTYEQVQRAHDEDADPLGVVAPLFALYEKLAAARRRRGTIELELPERVVQIGPEGTITGIVQRERLAAHMLIEEMMIAANVAAARALTERKAPCLFRVHDKPDPLRLEALAQYLEHLGIPWSANAQKPGDFTRLLERIGEPALREQVSAFVLRSQAQAIYSPENVGHFGLNLRRYAHFTSPIRRYSDLVVHRLLIHHLDLAGEGGATYDPEELQDRAEKVSACERRAVDAERRAQARYVALYMADRRGARFAGRVTGVQRFGLFVTLTESGADGLVPVSMLGAEYFLHDERHHALIGEKSGETFAMGDAVEVTLLEADTVKGMLVFRIEEHTPARAADLARAAFRRSGRPPGHRRRGGPPPGRRRGSR